MKALSGRVRVLKNSKQKLRLSSKKRLAMSSDLSKDKNEAFLSGVVEGEYCFFQPFSRSTFLDLLASFERLGTEYSAIIGRLAL